MLLRSTGGILGTIEVGNGFPRDGSDGEWKIDGRDAILTMKEGILKLATAEGDETIPRGDLTTPCCTVVRDTLDHRRRSVRAVLAAAEPSTSIGRATRRDTSAAGRRPHRSN